MAPGTEERFLKDIIQDKENYITPDPTMSRQSPTFHDRKNKGFTIRKKYGKAAGSEKQGLFRRKVLPFRHQVGLCAFPLLLTAILDIIDEFL